MSLHNAAKHLESKGRNGDTMLVHMTPGEVRGLQALALAKGGSLSINPDTGLVEASFLKKMLPTIAGIGLNMMFPGLGALATAGIVGGFETVRTGDLGKGLMAGLGAYGGAGIGQGLATAGQAAQGVELGASTLGSDTTMASISDKLATATPETADYFAKAYEAGATPSDTFLGRGAEMTKGIGSLGTTEGRTLAYNALPTGTLPSAGAALANAATPAVAAPAGYEPDEYDKRLRMRLSDSFTGYTPPQPNPYYRPTGLGYAAQGGSTGDIMMAAGGTYDDEPMGDVGGMAAGGIASYASQGQVRHLPRTPSIPDTGIYRDTDVDTARKDALAATMIRNKKLASGSNMPKNFLAKQPKTSIKGIGDVEEAAAGGSIGGYSDGGRMLKGPGDGMSDSIPATIGKRQPARLADGEFVVPADVVSHLGNGSTDAGAKKLYSMMDKVRRARTGKKKQAPAVKADKYMPA
jgi:hypothetical protein